MEDSGAEGDLNFRDLAQEIPGKNICVWPRDHSCDILVRNVAALCPCLKSQPEINLKLLIYLP